MKGPRGGLTAVSTERPRCLRAGGKGKTWYHSLGLGFAANFGKVGGFIGREALLAQKAAGPLEKRVVAFLFENPEPPCYHEEPIWTDGKIVGRTTAGMLGHTLGATVACGKSKNDTKIPENFECLLC